MIFLWLELNLKLKIMNFKKDLLLHCGTVLLGCCLSIGVYASPAKSACSEQVLSLKKRTIEELKESKDPIFISGLMTPNMDAEKVDIDVSGINELILSAWETVDGNGADHAVWADGILTATDGAKIYLDDLNTIDSYVGYATVTKKAGPSGENLIIGNKHYRYGLFAHAPSRLVYNLAGKYTKLTVDVGVNSSSSVGTIIFAVMTPKSQEILKRAYEKWNEIPILDRSIYGVLSFDLFTQWVTSEGTIFEQKLAQKAVSKLNDRDGLMAKIENISKLSSVKKQIDGYNSIIDLVNRIQNVDSRLYWVNPVAIELAFEDMAKTKGYDVATNRKLLDFINTNYATVKEGISKGNLEMLELAERIIEAKHTILMANPLLDMDQILVGRYKLGSGARTAMAPQLGTQIENYNSQPSAPRTGFDAEISILSNLRDDVKVTTIYEPKNSTSIADIHLHWSADKFLFTMSEDSEKWNVFEIGVDGKGLNKVVDVPEKDLDFCDGAYLPDGRILTTSTIGYHGVPCISGFDEVCNLVLYDRDKKDLRRLTYDQDGNWNPFIMNNGRVMYTRWEYADLTHYFSRIVMQMNPDGTENKSLYGSSSFWPNSTYDMKPLPNSTSKFVAIITGHHGIVRSGRLMIFDPAKSRKEEEGVVQELPFKDRKVIPEIKDYLVNGVWPQFTKPFPLDDKYFLVSAKLSPNGLWGTYLVDIYDNLTLISEAEGEGFIYAIPLAKRPVPPVIPDRVNLEDKESTIFIQDIYEGEGLRGVPRGVVKKLRLYAFEYGYIDSPTDHYAQGIQAGWDVKRLLGTVPVEEDGSVIFKVPANLPISIQPLDSLGRAVQWMRSWITSMPGEVVSCIGCHEDQNKIPAPKRTVASQIKPHKIEAPEGGVRSITFDLEVQPILDRACIACHNEEATINFAKTEMVAAPMDHYGFTRYYTNSYLAFHPYFYRQGPEADMYVLEPYEYHVSNSEMIRMLKKGHHGVKLTEQEWQSLTRWLDMNTPYLGTYDELAQRGGFNQYERRMELADKYNKGASVDWHKELADYADYLASKGKIVPVKPEELQKPRYKEPKVKGWPINGEGHEIERKVVEIAPGIEMTFVKVPSGEFVMGDNSGESDHSPAFKAKVERSFWIAESELTNDQYRALFPEHDSRFIGQFWKDHTTPGYPANLPTQPVIRVTWRDAIEYCEVLSEKTGLNISIPTEIQWEWAAKCGNDTPFWYGDVDTDFSKYDNLADKTLSDMAVIGVDPKPMGENNPWFKFYDYLPKEKGVNDNSLLLTHVKSYQPNLWGVYDMNGNVAEWTRSDYLQYPLNRRSKAIMQEKVVRGGSWIDRPKYSTSNSRKSFLPWQTVVNVGIRLIIEE